MLAPAIFKKRFSVATVLAAIMILAALLRLPTLKMGLWLDEFVALYLCSQPSIHSMLSLAPSGMDLNPPLFHLILRGFTHIFGTGEVTVRIPSFILGVLLIPAVYWLGKTIHSQSVGMLAACFAALSPQANYFACQARPYALAVDLACLSLVFFCQLIDPKVRNKRLTLVFFVLATSGLMYTTSMAVPMLLSLAVASLLLLLQQRLRSVEEAASANRVEPISVKLLAAALFIPTFAFTPWLPVAVKQMAIPKWVEPTPLLQWPLAFLGYLAIMIPVPLLLGLILTLVALVFSGFLIVANLRKDGLSTLFSRSRIKSAFKDLAPPYIVLVCAVVVPAVTVDYLTAFYLGYNRYIFSYSPAEWVLLAVCMHKAFNSAGAPEGGAQIHAANGQKKGVLFALILLALFIIDATYVISFAEQPQSGLKLVAQAVRNGRFDNCAILLAPDWGGPTLTYYLSQQERAAHHVLVCGFPRWDPTLPCACGPLHALWSPPGIVVDTERRINELQKEGYEYLAFASDDFNPGTAAVPVRLRIRQLLERIQHKYKLVRTERYKGAAETHAIAVFKLEPAKE